MIFLIIHALGRFNRGEQQVTLQYLDRRTVKDINDSLASFFPALELYEIFNVATLGGCNRVYSSFLRPGIFTQEFISHGTIKTEDERFPQAPIEALISAGLFVLKPELKIPDNHKYTSLYECQVALRRSGYPPQSHLKAYSYTKCRRTTPFTDEILGIAKDLARLLTKIPGDKSPEAHPPHLHIFLHFLTFDKRPRRDEKFLTFIRDHYNGKYD